MASRSYRGRLRLSLPRLRLPASNPDKPAFYLDMPVALVDGKAKIVPEVFDRIVAADPTHQVDRYLAQPERLRAISALSRRW